MKRSHGSAGFSLIEVLVALGMMAGVLISVAGLLTLGGRYVKSGRSASEALAVARDIMEEMQGWGFHQTYTLFGEDGSAGTYKIRTDNLQPADYIWQEPGDPTWQEILDRTLQQARAEIDVTALAGNLNAATGIRIDVTVYWMEGTRPREVRLSTIRL